MDNICEICSERCDFGKILSNGNRFHENCYEQTLLTNRNLENEIYRLKDKISQIERLNRTPLKKLKHLFSIATENDKKNEKQVLEFQDKIEYLVAKKRKIKQILNNLYDYWMVRPPDWDERRRIKISENKFCAICKKDSSHLHIHHIRPISKGGNHTSNNLEVLCSNCHQGKHHHSFSYKDFNEKTENNFEKKVELITEAINYNALIKFNYRKFSGEKSVRTIQPENIEMIGNSLCVSGFCFLRNCDRVFAIQRITNLKLQ